MFRFKRTAALLLPIALIYCYIFAPFASAAIYQWKDADGNIVYGDSPPPGADAASKNVRLNKLDAPLNSQTRGQAWKGRSKNTQLRDVSDINVILYKADWCPHCRNARAFLISKGVRLTEYDVDKDPGAAKEARIKSGTGAIPVIDIEGTIIVGDNLDAISQAIEQKRKER